MANGLFGGGTGTLNDPYLIEDAFDLDAMRNNLTANYKLIANIDLNISPFNEGEGWIPIGDNSTNNNNSRFRGVFDGNGFVVRNLYINRPSKDHQGLFGYTNGSTIKNIGVENVNITGSVYIGGLVGYNSSSSVIKNSYSTGSVTSSVGSGSRAGGLVGINISSSIIENSYSTASVTGIGFVGGLVGYNTSSSVIKNSYSTGSVTGGGLVGQNNSSSVINSYWDIETSGRTTSAGGVGKTTAEMQTPSTFVGWENEVLEDGTPIWILEYGEYPYLWFEDRTINKTLILHDGKYKKWNNRWQEVSSLLPTSTHFLEEGMDDLSILNRQLTELPPMQMEDKTSILFTNGEVGKVFSKTIDLKKYFDIRSLKIEVK